MAQEASGRQIEFRFSTLDISLRAIMWFVENPTISNRVWEVLPLESIMGHAVVAGGGIWLPTRIVHLGPNRMVKRSPGDVYFFGSGQSICLTYGAITETARVNKFAQVVDGDMDDLRNVGRHVWEETLANARRSIVPVVVRRVAA